MLHHYCFAHEAGVIIDHKWLVAIFKKDASCLSQRHQRILLRICQYYIRILYKPGPQLFIRYCLSKHMYVTNRVTYITTCVIELYTDIPDCVAAKEIRIATLDDEHICVLSQLILCSLPLAKAAVHKYLQPYWSFRDEITILDSIAMEGRRIIIPTVMRDKPLKQLYVNHIVIEKTRLLAGWSIYWNNMKAYIQKMVGNFLLALIS